MLPCCIIVCTWVAARCGRRYRLYSCRHLVWEKTKPIIIKVICVAAIEFQIVGSVGIYGLSGDAYAAHFF